MDAALGRYLGFKYNICTIINMGSHLTRSHDNHSCRQPSTIVISTAVLSTVENCDGVNVLFTIVVHCVDNVVASFLACNSKIA